MALRTSPPPSANSTDSTSSRSAAPPASPSEGGPASAAADEIHAGMYHGEVVPALRCDHLLHQGGRHDPGRSATRRCREVHPVYARLARRVVFRRRRGGVLAPATPVLLGLAPASPRG